MTHVIINNDCLAELKSLPDNLMDSLVTDPPAGIAFMGKDWDKDKGGRTEWVAWMAEVMREALRVLKPGAHGLVWALPRTSHWTATALEDAGFEVRDVVTHLFGSGFPKSLNVGKQTGLKEHEGLGTALKPASEHWILVRKPLSEKTVAANVLKWGTGALNVDASRIPSPGGLTPGGCKRTTSPMPMNRLLGASDGANPNDGHPQGRFPANLTLDEYAAGLLDEQSGDLQSGSRKAGVRKGMGFHGDGDPVIEGSTSGASRFFYVAKASKRDKNAGLEGMPERALRTLEDNGRTLKTGSGNERKQTAQNFHPTVKSTALMTYLIHMVTPPGGIVLDPFMGSGSTGVAAINNGFRFLGYEQDSEYFVIAENRIKSAA